jgi:hypothetical protein
MFTWLRDLGVRLLLRKPAERVTPAPAEEAA